MKNKRAIYLLLCMLIGSLALWGCRGALQRGMIGNTYISTARPAISLTVKDMPLMTAGSNIANLEWTGMLGGLPIQVWLAVYGEGALSPLAIAAQAQTPDNWYWDGIMRQPFSVDEGVEVFNNTGYQACTFIVNPARDPFGDLVTGVQPDGQPQQWLARAFAARYNFNNDKIILQYREPLPQAITSLTALPMGYGDYLQKFAQRARNAFVIAGAPQNPANVIEGYPQGIQWQYMDQNFLGTVSRYETLNFR